MESLRSKFPAYTSRRNCHETPADDMFNKLECMEKDLVLAAEFGNSLLQSNQKLIEEGELLVDEWSQKIEVITCTFNISCRKPYDLKHL